jgi:DNA-binding NtrC family response regulator
MWSVINYILKKLFKIFKRKDKQPELSPLKELSSEEFESSKFKARIAFIDDEEISHVERLRQDGYNITQYTDIENIDDFVRKKYHVVILDIQGVGQKLSPNSEGWGLLKYLKNSCPNLVVIMFTGAEWSITKYKDEADIADDFIGKDLEFLDFKSKLDNGIRKAFSPKFHFEIEKEKLSKEISNANTLDLIKTIIENFGANKKVALNELKKVSTNKSIIDSVDHLLSITNEIMRMLQ